MEKKSKLDRFLNGKGFYAVLGICMVAIGISAFGGYSALKNGPETAENSSDSTSYYVESEAENQISELPLTVDTPQSDVPYSESKVSSAEESKAPSPAAKYFIYPVSGEIIKAFSDSELQYSLTYNDMRLHTGVDIAADAKTAVNSAGDGTVIYAEKDSLLGYTVKIDHGNGIIGVYGGLAEVMVVKKGDTVSAGTNLGSVGVVTSESLDAPHLHLEFLQDGKAVDPLSLIAAN